MLVHGPQHGGQEDKELGVVQRGLAGIEQVVALGIADGPVVVLAAAVDAGKGLFVEQADEVMPRRDLVQQVHDEHVVVGGDVGVLVDGRDLELTGGHLVMPGLGRDAEAEQGVFHILHEGHDARRDGAEVVVFHLLALGGRGAHQRASRQQQVGAQGGKTAVDKEVFLFRSHTGAHEGGRIVAEQAQDAQGLPGKGGNGTHERDLAVQGLARIAVEQGGHMQGAADDEGRDRGIPGRVTAGLEGGAQAAGRERGGIRLAADEHLAREFVDDAAFTGGSKERIVLFGRQAGHGLEPVGVVRGALADGPVLHGAGHGIRDVRIKAFAAGDGGLQHAEHGLGQALLQDVEGENVATEDGVDLGGGGLVVRMALGDLPDGVGTGIHEGLLGTLFSGPPERGEGETFRGRPDGEENGKMLNSCSLQGGGAAFTGTDADGVQHVVDEDLAIADLAGAGHGDCLQHLFQRFVMDHDLDLDLGQAVHGVGGAAIDFRMPVLAAEAAHFAVVHAVDADSGQLLLHFFELGRTDDDFELFHDGLQIFLTAGGEVSTVTGCSRARCAG